ncbi:hypothetical protein FOA52_006097 [Chlamydomonas sp. UWO 241]|nr:hypothetical protein FOA52_009697 [Chlamydomonas sp. UWO 241]KAG1652935.1 hypothetical protein FOA52_006097 [Chlamydomonas sp. UWO 241]
MAPSAAWMACGGSATLLGTCSQLLISRVMSGSHASCSLAAMRSLSSSAQPAAREAGGSGSTADAAHSPAVEAALQALERGPVALARRVAGLAVMSALYRDMALVATSIDARLAGSPDPLFEDAPRPSAETAAATAAPPPAFPLHDTTKLPDSDAPRGLQLEQRHMDKISAWAALQPSHIETSHTLLTGVNLFPPQEAAYPTYVDFDAVVKGLEQRKSRSRLNLLRRLRQRQDKYQLKTWDHHSGH